jgi:methyl-accepting chemotaxis protein
MTIAQKLLFSFGGISLVLMLGMSNEVRMALSSKSEMNTLSQIVDSGKYVSALVHEMQIERGMTAGFIASKGTKGKESIETQRKKVDDAFNRLMTVSKTNLPSLQVSELTAMLESKTLLIQKRQEALELSISAPDWISASTAIIKHGIDFMNNSIEVADIARTSQALSLLIVAKELAGQERATGNAAFSAGKFANATAMQKFIALGSQRKALLEEFIKLAPAAQINSLKAQQNSDLFTLLAKMENDAVAKSFAGQALETDPAEWFAKSTQRINYFKELEDALQQDIQAMASQEVANAGITVWTMIALVLLLVSMVTWLYISVVHKGIRDPLNNMVERIRQIATSSRFNERVIYDAQDEIGDTARALNLLLGNLEHSINEANKVVGAIARADFQQRMTGQYVGDLEVLKQGVNGSAESVAFMIKELEKVMNGLHQGKFDVTMDTKVPKAFRDLVEVALQRMAAIITEMNQVMLEMSQGHFNVRIRADASGALLEMKERVNASMNDITEAVNLMSEVVGAQAMGDLTHELASGVFKGQLHDLKNAINYSGTKVKEVVADMIEASQVVSQAAGQVSQGASDLSSRVQEQAAALEQTSATMTEMTVAVQTNTANAKRVAELANQVKSQSSQGVAVMQQTITAMQSIQESSHKINDIVTLIDGIAFQTNLLALNAAVEAARAGEHGRGFAVVAGEVRALAQKSASAAKDIKDLITESVHRIETGTQLADKSGEMLNGITGSIEQVATMIEEIAVASSEQSTGISQVHLAMNNIDRVTQENAALVEETTAASESLNHEAHKLRENMAFFKTGHIQQRKPNLISKS